MAFEATVFWLVVLFSVMVTASFVGTTAALRMYFGNEGFGLSDAIRIDDADER